MLGTATVVGRVGLVPRLLRSACGHSSVGGVVVALVYAGMGMLLVYAVTCYLVYADIMLFGIRRHGHATGIRSNMLSGIRRYHATGIRRHGHGHGRGTSG